MQFITSKELSQSPSKYMKLANEGVDIIITKNGHPYALLSKFKEDDLEDFILAKHFNLEEEFIDAKKDYQEGKTLSARDLLSDVNKKISNEISS